MTISSVNPCLKKIAVLFLSAALLVTGAQSTEVSAAGFSETAEQGTLGSYEAYLAAASKTAGQGEIILTAKNCISMDEGSSIAEPEEAGSVQSVHVAFGGNAVWEFDVQNEGLYDLSLDYMMLPGHENSAEYSILLDGESPYDDLKHLTLFRLWTDVLGESGEFQRDLLGNDIAPDQAEIAKWSAVKLYSETGFYNQPLQLYLTPGKHTLSIGMLKETAAFAGIVFSPATQLPAYKEVLEEYKSKGYKDVSCTPILLEAEKPSQKSNFTITPLSDNTSSATSPQSATATRLNTIGGSRWTGYRQWISWEFTVPEDGFYTVGLRYRQNINSGIFSSRVLKINGEVPFQEAQNLRYIYDSSWQYARAGADSLSGGFKFAFDQGKTYTLTLEVTLGDMAELINDLNGALQKLNKIYRDILMVTGPTPDFYRDYNFETMIPDALESMAIQSAALKKEVDRLIGIAGGVSENTAIINSLIYQLDRMHDETSAIASNFKMFKDNIGALGTLLQTMRGQPLELDYITVSGAASPASIKNDGFFNNLWFQLKLFAHSFFIDYRKIGMTTEQGERKQLKVWVATGRDQAKIIRTMIDNDFCKQYGDVSVRLELVAAGTSLANGSSLANGTLLPAVLSGIGPDIALSNDGKAPVDFAMRNAVMDLTRFDDLDQITQRFMPSAMVPFSFNGGVYALPETQSFPMMFYRTDTFGELGLAPPETWEQFYALVPELSKNNLEIGYPLQLPGILIFLYQQGEGLYRDNGKFTNLDTDAAISSFNSACDLFSIYKFPVEYSFINRFRTGEMPLGIVDYSSTYNQLSVFAPEIKGLWSVVPVPGTVRADKTVDHSVGAETTAVMMMNQTKEPEIAWSFMKWWTDEPVMKQYALGMETVLGPSAKQPVANIQAFKGLSWSVNELDAIVSQWESAQGTPQVPGGYITERQLNFAFTRCAGFNENAADVMLDYIRPINKELARKRKEFGLDRGTANG